jgi:uncharacterized membrane protein
LPQKQTLELAGPWGFYEVFRSEHNLAQLPRAEVPEIAIARGATLQVPLNLNNLTDSAQSISLSVTVPDGWKVKDFDSKFSMKAGEVQPVLVAIDSPLTETKETQEITCRAGKEGKAIGEVKLRVRLRSGGLPQ